MVGERNKRHVHSIMCEGRLFLMSLINVNSMPVTRSILTSITRRNRLQMLAPECVAAKRKLRVQVQDFSLVTELLGL